VKLTDHPLVQQLLSLELPPEDFVIFGSGPLLAHGIKDNVPDLDVLARGEAWRKATEFETPEPAPSGIGKVIRPFGDNIEIFDDWMPKGWDVNELIDKADVIEGIRFIPLKTVLEWKEFVHRPKDEDDIALLRKHLHQER
jgi:hypothetical protein